MDSKWNIDSLKEHFEERFRAGDKSIEAAFRASEKAIDKSEAAQTAYNARSNEFRAALDDQAKAFLPRSEAEVSFEQFREQIARLQQSDSRGEGESSAMRSEKANSQAIWYLAIVVALQALAGIGSLIFYLATRK